MAVTSKNMRTGQPTPVVGPLRYTRALAYGVTLLLAVLAIYALVSLLLGRANLLLDDLRYGRPRTFQADAYVGHSEVPGRPTHLLAVNLSRQVVLIELPGGDASKVRTINGPYLFGAGEDLTPVTLELQDVDGDGQVDALLNVRQERIIYLNRDGGFRPATPDELAQIATRNR